MFEEEYEIVDLETTVQDKILRLKDEFYSKWSEININSVDNIKQKWVSKEAIEFIEQINKLNELVNQIMNNFDELSGCWIKYNKKKEMENEQ